MFQRSLVVVACLDGVAATVPRLEDPPAILAARDNGSGRPRAARPMMLTSGNGGQGSARTHPHSVVLDPSAHEAV